jgi:hypothetical protein
MPPERPLQLLPPIRVDDHSPLRQGLMYKAGVGYRGRRPQELSEAVRHTGGADPFGDVVFIVDLHPCGERSRAGESAFAEGLEDRLDRVVRRDAGGGLGQRRRLPGLTLPLRHVSDGEGEEPLALEVQHGALHLSRFSAWSRAVRCIYSCQRTGSEIVASNLTRHSRPDRAYFAELPAERSGRRHPAA